MTNFVYYVMICHINYLVLPGMHADLAPIHIYITKGHIHDAANINVTIFKNLTRYTD